jgi:predicted PurR-regulated permease PerM
MIPRRAAMIAAVAAYAWWATALRPFSTPATIAIVGAGALAEGAGLTYRHRRPRPIVRRGVAVWLVVAALLSCWQLAAFVQEPRQAHPTVSSIINDTLDAHLVRALACVGWLVVARKLAQQ